MCWLNLLTTQLDTHQAKQAWLWADRLSTCYSREGNRPNLISHSTKCTAAELQGERKKNCGFVITEWTCVGVQQTVLKMWLQQPLLAPTANQVERHWNALKPWKEEKQELWTSFKSKKNCRSLQIVRRKVKAKETANYELPTEQIT